jgi:hypothetical protein
MIASTICGPNFDRRYISVDIYSTTNVFLSSSGLPTSDYAHFIFCALVLTITIDEGSLRHVNNAASLLCVGAGASGVGLPLHALKEKAARLPFYRKQDASTLSTLLLTLP